MVKSKINKRSKINKIGGSFWNDLQNLSIIPGFSSLNTDKLYKKLQRTGGKKIKSKNNTKKNNRSKELKGGFIRGGVPQHFYGSKNINTRRVYDTQGVINNDIEQFRGGQKMNYTRD